MALAAQQPQLKPAPAGLKAGVWGYFGFRTKLDSEELDRTVAICKLCSTAVKFCNNTTNLRAHISRHHPEKKLEDEPKTPRDPKQQVLDVSAVCTHKLPSTSPKALRITEAIGKFICQDLRPYSVVENVGFRSMVEAMEPRYRIPTREHLTKVVVPRLYNKTKTTVKDALASAERVALTCDGWTSRTTEAYVTITSHFINDNWEIVSYVLQTRPMPESHTGLKAVLC